jgi:hypothetical protein
MRKFLIFLAVLAIAGFVYNHKRIWNRLSGAAAEMFATPAPTPKPVPGFTDQPYAVRIWGRISADSLTLRRSVLLVDGDRWRFESKDSDSPAVTVALSNGSDAASNIGSFDRAIALDPRPMMTTIFAAAAQLRAGPPPSLGTEPCDGHTCWQGSVNLAGVTSNLWIDADTGYPVFLVSTGTGKFTDEHLEQLPIDFHDPAVTEFFDPKHTESFFGQFLNP